jgi:hypothetical protein
MTLARDTKKIETHQRAGALALLELGRGGSKVQQEERPEQQKRTTTKRKSNEQALRTGTRRYRSLHRPMDWGAQLVPIAPMEATAISDDEDDENSVHNTPLRAPVAFPAQSSTAHLSLKVRVEFRNYKDFSREEKFQCDHVGTKNSLTWVGRPLSLPPRLPLVSPLALPKPLTNFSAVMQYAPAMPPPPSKLGEITRALV